MGSRLVADVIELISELGYLKETVETERIQITFFLSTRTIQCSIGSRPDKDEHFMNFLLLTRSIVIGLKKFHWIDGDH
jgi:hypothetical protein